MLVIGGVFGAIHYTNAKNIKQELQQIQASYTELSYKYEQLHSKYDYLGQQGDYLSQQYKDLEHQYMALEYQYQVMSKRGAEEGGCYSRPPMANSVLERCLQNKTGTRGGPSENSEAKKN